jgi:O-antigen/teichoic acid export membrane protein
MAPAFLYRDLQRSPALRSHLRVIAGLAALGLAGWLGAVLLGPSLLSLVFGPAFTGSQGYLVAGFGAAVLFFIDQFVQISITSANRPGVLALKWGVACLTAAATLALATPWLGAYAGPAGLAAGLAAGWVAVALAPRARPPATPVSSSP